jgi:hypothetical protein
MNTQGINAFAERLEAHIASRIAAAALRATPVVVRSAILRNSRMKLTTCCPEVTGVACCMNRFDIK